MNKMYKRFTLNLRRFAVILVAAVLLNMASVEAQNSTRVVINPVEMTIHDLQLGYQTGLFTIEEVVASYLNRIENIDQNGPALNSIISINPDALEIARRLDNQRKCFSNPGPLYGVPVIIKDNIDTKDRMPTTAGSRALVNSFPLEDSYLVARLRDAGAVILGKANLSEWANFRGRLSTSGWSGLGGLTRNPYDLDRNPCGSSSGSAVAVSANLCMVAIGTETNGSIVCPAHSNGIVGIKPTVGLISRKGVIPISYTQDTPGPMARTVTDAVITLGYLTGIDDKDAKTLESRGKVLADYTAFLKSEGLQGKRIGLDKSAYGINFKVDSLMDNAIQLMKDQGATIIEVGKFYPQEVNRLSFEIMLHEYRDGLNAYFSSLGEHAPIKSLEELIEFNRNDEVELKYFDQYYLELAQSKEGMSSDTYRDALEKMLKGSRKEGIDKIMDEFNLDAIVAPTGSPAWKTDLVNGDSFQFGTSSAAAQSGYPNITVPMGFVDHLPVGISFFGRAWSEPVLIEIAYGFESKTRTRKAPFFECGNSD